MKRSLRRSPAKHIDLLRQDQVFRFPDRPAQHDLVHIEQLRLRQGKHDGDRVDQRQDRQRIGVAGVDDVSGIDLPHTGPAIDRRRDSGIAELNLGTVDRGLVSAHCRL